VELSKLVQSVYQVEAQNDNYGVNVGDWITDDESYVRNEYCDSATLGDEKRFKTTDGKVFESKDEAVAHQETLTYINDVIEKASALMIEIGKMPQNDRIVANAMSSLKCAAWQGPSFSDLESVYYDSSAYC